MRAARRQDAWDGDKGILGLPMPVSEGSPAEREVRQSIAVKAGSSREGRHDWESLLSYWAGDVKDFIHHRAPEVAGRIEYDHF